MADWFEDAWAYLWSDPLKEGIRLMLAVLTFMIPLWLAQPQIDAHYYADAIRNGLQWAAVTCVVISQSLLGKASQVSFERVVGTIIGGSLAMAMLFSEQAGAVLSLLGLLCIWATFLGGKLKLDYGGKLCCVTYIIVCGCVCRGASAIVSVWLSRTLGICSGVGVSLLLNISVFPRSATNKAMQEFRKAIKTLSKMHSHSWDVVTPSVDPDQASEQRKKDSEACEEAYLSAISSLRAIEDSIPITEDESILCSLLGQRILLPRWHWLFGTDGNSSFPAGKGKSLATALRRSYRALWSLHIAFDDGFGLDLTLAFIARHSYSGLLAELQSSMKDFLTDLLNAFPSSYGGVNAIHWGSNGGTEPVSKAGLERYSKALNDLMELSDSNYHHLMETGRIAVASKEAPLTLSESTAKDKPAMDAASVSIVIEAQPPEHDETVPPSLTPRAWQLSVASSMMTGKEIEAAATVASNEDEEGKAVIGSPLQARLRWFSARFAMQCLLRETKELASAANELLMILPGHEVKGNKSNVTQSTSDR